MVRRAANCICTLSERRHGYDCTVPWQLGQPTRQTRHRGKHPLRRFRFARLAWFLRHRKLQCAWIRQDLASDVKVTILIVAWSLAAISLACSTRLRSMLTFLRYFLTRPVYMDFCRTSSARVQPVTAVRTDPVTREQRACSAIYIDDDCSLLEPVGKQSLRYRLFACPSFGRRESVNELINFRHTCPCVVKDLLPALIVCNAIAHGCRALRPSSLFSLLSLARICSRRARTQSRPGSPAFAIVRAVRHCRTGWPSQCREHRIKATAVKRCCRSARLRANIEHCGNIVSPARRPKCVTITLIDKFESFIALLCALVQLGQSKLGIEIIGIGFDD